MAGHSKWANIKHRKARQDAKKGKVFSKIIKLISSAARRGGGDPDGNPELRLVLDKARAANVPSENIDRAIAKATGQLDGVSYEDFSYEGYGPGGVAILLEGSTDNRNRTVAELRHAFSKHGGNMGENGCVAWMFEAKGILALASDSVNDPDAAMELALEHGADDFESEGDTVTITTTPENFPAVRDAFAEAGFTDFITDEITKIAQNTTEIPADQTQKAMNLIEVFEDHDDVESVYSNLEVSEEVLAQLGG